MKCLVKKVKNLKLFCLLFCIFSLQLSLIFAATMPAKNISETATAKDTKVLWTELKFSLYGDICFPRYSYNVAGLDFGLLHTKTDKVYGIQIAGIGAKINKIYGIQVAGLGSQNNIFYGLQVAGLGTVTNNFYGIQVAGFGAENDKFCGLQISGLGCNTNKLYGIGLSPIFKYKKLYGFCFEIFGDVQYSESCYGMQISGFDSKIQDLRGLQISLYNAAVSSKGMQLGLINVAEKVCGVQIGLYNSCSELKGVQIGFINHSEKAGIFDIDTVPIINVGV